MGILLAFAPFIAFAIVDRLAGSIAGLAVGTIVSAALIGRDLVANRAPKILEIGTVILFGGLTLLAYTGSVSLSVIGVRLCVDAGLLAIVLVSMVVRRPFTLQYGRDHVPADLWSSPEFVRTNYIISGVWAVAFAVMVLAELAILVVPGLPPRVGVVAIVLALVGAIKFTGWFPEHRKTLE